MKTYASLQAEIAKLEKEAQALRKAEVANVIALRIDRQFQDLQRKERNYNYVALDTVTQELNRKFEGGIGKHEMAKATDSKSVSVRVERRL